VAGDDIDPVYFDSPYFVYPDGPIAVEVLRVIGAAMAKVGVVGLGHLTLSRRERMVVVEPRGTGMALFTLRAAGEVRAPQFGSAEGDLDTEMVAIAGAIIRQRTGNFDPSTYHDRYQEALQQLIEAKMKGVTIEPRTVSTPSPVIDLMAALKRSLAQEPSAPEQKTAKRHLKAVGDPQEVVRDPEARYWGGPPSCNLQRRPYPDNQPARGIDKPMPGADNRNKRERVNLLLSCVFRSSIDRAN